MEGSPVHAPPVVGIDHGMPGSSQDWPAGLLAKLATVRQGDVVSSVPLVYVGAPQAPVWGRTKDYAAFEGIMPIVSDPVEAPPYYVITSQTCDIVESAADRPSYAWIQVAPVFDMTTSFNSGERRMLAKRGWRRWLWHLPALGNGFWVADLRIEIPLEKGVLAELDVIPGHADEVDRRSFGARLANRRSRPAFSDQFVSVIQAPLVGMLRELERRDATLFAAMDPDVEVYVRLDDHLAPTTVEVVLVSDRTASPEVVGWWQEWWDVAHQEALKIGVNLMPLLVTSADDLTLTEFRQLTRLPLDRVSPD